VRSNSTPVPRLPARFDPFRYFKWGGLALVTLTLLSTVVFWSLGHLYHRPDWTWMNCLFMVVITLTTIGYGDWLELRGLHLAEAFTMLLAMIGIAAPAFLVSNVTALIVEGLFTDIFRRRRMDKQIAKMHGHIIVCGVGTTGVHCVNELRGTGREVVAIDRDEEKLKRLCDEVGEFPYIVGSAESDEVLRRAGIERASGLLACLTEDKDNVFVTLTARSMNKQLRIISKVLEDQSRRKLGIAGANGTVNPTAIGGLRLVSELVRPTVVTFLDNMMRDRDSSHRFEELVVETGSPIAGRTLLSANLRTQRTLVVAARQPGETKFIYNPTPDLLLGPGVVIVLLASTADLQQVRKLFQTPAAAPGQS
jgi:voltage-gated potassium channel